MEQGKLVIVGSGRVADDASSALVRQGFAVEQVDDPGPSLCRLRPDAFDLALLGGGCAARRLRLCAAIRRRWGGVPILLLGAAPEEVEMMGRPAGPDDFVVRERDEIELCARVRALLRQSAGGRAGPLACGPLTLDPAARSAGLGGRWVELTATEFQLLSRLARAKERAVVGREELLRTVWGYEHEGYSHTLTTHVSRLREKLERELGTPRVIETVRGLGYRIAAGE